MRPEAPIYPANPIERPWLPSTMPASTLRLEVEEVGENRIDIVAWPSGRIVESIRGGSSPINLKRRAAAVLDRHEQRLKVFREYMERPYGTCVACAGALTYDGGRWCPFCRAVPR